MKIRDSEIPKESPASEAVQKARAECIIGFLFLVWVVSIVTFQIHLRLLVSSESHIFWDCLEIFNFASAALLLFGSSRIPEGRMRRLIYFCTMLYIVVAQIEVYSLGKLKGRPP